MKKYIFLLPLVAILVACGTSDPYERRARKIYEQQETNVKKNISKAPEWMIKPPVSDSAIYAGGTSASGDFSMAVAKAKADAYSKICMAAGGTASQRTKIYKADTEDNSTELSEMIIRTACKEVDVTGAEISDQMLMQEGNRYRAYVLIALPTGEANVLKRAKEKQKLQEIARQRAPEAFKELDE